jgi:hypothetical protein
VSHLHKPACLIALLLGLAMTVPPVWAQVRELGPNHWAGVPRVVAFGDVHGAYDQMVAALKSADVVDAELNWAAGDTHLVSLGDLLDRGAHSRQTMDLLMRLQKQAADAGGRVHVVLGNHELMNLTGDMRYVAAEEFAAFSDDEDPTKRSTARAAFIAAADPASGKDPATEFDERYPAGFFGHRAGFAAAGSYGQWILQLPLIVVVNETAFVHGGLPALVADQTLEGINRQYQRDLTEIMTLGSRLVDAGWVSADRDLLLQDDAVLARLEALADGEGPDLSGAGRRFIELVRGPLFGSRGPNWYRGTAMCHASLEETVLNAALKALGAKRVVVGHTPTSNRRVQQRMDGRAILADTGMLRSYYGGQPAPVILKGEEIEILYPLTETRADAPDVIDPLARYGLDQDQLEVVMSSAAIAEVSTAGTGQRLTTVTLTHEGKRYEFAFERGSGSDNDHKVGAYRLSRLLELNLVPVTVSRTVEGAKGVLMALPEKRVSETERATQGLGRSNWCSFGNDYQLMYAFDALIRNERRTTDTMIYDREDWQLTLIGHEASFGNGTDLPAYLASVEKTLPAAMAARMSAMNEQSLMAALGDQLSKRQIRAVIKRRDRMIRDWQVESL